MLEAERMPRKSRIDAPDALHHIIARGIERKKIFREDTDRENFLDRLGDILTDTKTKCCARALMPNHFHLLPKTSAVEWVLEMFNHHLGPARRAYKAFVKKGISLGKQPDL